jgi:hypothetical protein
VVQECFPANFAFSSKTQDANRHSLTE